MNRRFSLSLPTNLRPSQEVWRLVWPLAIALTGIALLVALYMADTVLMIAAGLCGLVLVFLRPALGMVVYIFLLFSLHWLTDSLQVLPKLFNLVPDALALAMFLSATARRLYRHRTLPRTPIDVGVMLFTVVAVASALLNQRDPLLVLLNGLFRQNLKFILLFYAIVYLDWPERLGRRMINLFIMLMLLQIPVSMMQLIATGNWDLAGGTLGFATTGVLALAALMTMALLFGFAYVRRRLRYALLGLAFFIPLVAGEGKIAFVFGPLMLMFLFLHRGALLRARALLLVVLFVGVFVLAIGILNAVLPQARSLDVLSSLSFTLNYYERSLEGTGDFPRSRLGDLQFTLRLLSTSLTRMLFGYGPGSSSPAFAESASGSLYRQYESFQGSYFYFSFIQLSTTLLEYGGLGLAVYLFTIWRIYRYNGRLLRLTTDRFWYAVSWGFRGVVLIYLLGIVYWRIWSTELLASIFWILAGILAAQIRRWEDTRHDLDSVHTLRAT